MGGMCCLQQYCQEHAYNGLMVEMNENMRLFRNQRNFVICGFALFLSLVIRRLVILISLQAELLAQSTAAIRQAQSASTTARTLLVPKGDEQKNSNESVSKDKEITELRDTIKELEEKLIFERKEKKAVKDQTEGLHKEYGRLAEEHSKLQKNILSSGDKKDD